MAINNVNEFLRKTFSKTIFGTPALRPIAVCADGFNLSIQASSMHYCRPSKDLQDGDYSKVELGNDYYIIDMALAENSALNDCVPSNRLRAYPQQWLPGESNN